MKRFSFFVAVIIIGLFFLELTAETDDNLQLKVKNIHFIGNISVSRSELLNLIETSIEQTYNQQTAIEDSEKISDIYNSKGIYNVKVLYPEAIPINAKDVDVYFYIEEMGQYIINEIALSGNSYISKERILQATGVRDNITYSLQTLNSLMISIVDFYASKGYLFAKTTLDSLVVNIAEDTQESQANEVPLTANISVDEGKYCRFTNFVFDGNKVTKEQTLLRISGLDRLDSYPLYHLQLAEENVRKKEYIKEFSVIPINYETLLLKIEEDRMTSIYGILGYDSSQNKASDRLTGFVNLKLLNLYGTDRTLAFFWRKLTAKRQSVEFRYYESGPFNFPVAGELLLYRETVDSTYIKTMIDSEIFYYTLRNKYGLYMGTDDIFPGSRRNDSDAIVEKQSYKKLGLFWYYDSEDYYLNPTEGMGFKVKHYYIFHKERGKQINKQATEISWTNYLPIFDASSKSFNKPVVLMLSLNGKQTENRNLKEYEYYSLGGIQNIRGFRESQFENGYRIFWANFETRYLLTRKSRLFLFTDYGYIQRQESTLKDLFGLGFGVRLDTKIGLVGVDYGFGHSENKWMHPLDGMVHFGVETKF